MRNLWASPKPEGLTFSRRLHIYERSEYTFHNRREHHIICNTNPFRYAPSGW